MNQDNCFKSNDNNTDFDIAIDIMKLAQNMHLIKFRDEIHFIPEIASEKNHCCQVLRQELIKIGKTEKNALKPTVWCLWSIYAGLGATFHWQHNWSELKIKGVPETLIEPRGIFAMDEYVLDFIGYGFSSKKGKELSNQLTTLVIAFIMDRIKLDISFYTDDQTKHLMQAMYIFGMALGIEILGQL